jgi:hypothetical protein
MADNTNAVIAAATTNVRDKLILVALIVFGTCAFISIWINRELAQVMVGLIVSIVTGMFGIYKGNLSSDSSSPTAAVTSTTATQTTETVSDTKGT